MKLDLYIQLMEGLKIVNLSTYLSYNSDNLIIHFIGYCIMKTEDSFILAPLAFDFPWHQKSTGEWLLKEITSKLTAGLLTYDALHREKPEFFNKLISGVSRCLGEGPADEIKQLIAEVK